MKTKNLLLLVSFVFLTTIARAAQSPTDNEIVVLPTYTVEAPRNSPVEQQIASSLDELRLLAKAPMVMTVDCTALKAVVRHGSAVAQKNPARKTAQFVKS